MLNKWLTALLIVSITLSGCGRQESKPEQEIKPEVTKPEPILAPLSGRTLNEQSDARPIAVMINNHPKARPQSGLSKADVVYELLAEGDLTRLLGVFQSQFPERFGPVRSARDYYIELAQGLHALYICHGHSPEAKALFDAGAIDELDGMRYDGTLFKRDPSRYAPHNSYITYENVLAGAEKEGYTTTEQTKGFVFATAEQLAEQFATATDARRITIRYAQSNVVSYAYDEATHAYMRSVNGELQTDRIDGAPITAANIFVVMTEHTIQDNYGRRDIDLKSGGVGILFQNGKRREVTWQNDDGRLVAYDNGHPAALLPGTTWVQVVPKSGQSVHSE
ncbi:MAG: DUF3048 domain-containing protein [Bacilli bacterium]